MGVKHGLSVDGINYFAEVIKNKKVPDWMQMGQQVGKMTGHYEILNFLTGYKNMDQFLFHVPKWPIGGIYFDGIMRTEHTSRIRPTQYPVQTGVTMTDHAIIEPADVTIEIFMTDAARSSFLQMPMNPVPGTILSLLGMSQGIFASNRLLMQLYSNFGDLPCTPPMTSLAGDGRSAAMWKSLRSMQLARVPITVETRLQTYHNMLIEELSAPDDVKTLHALSCTVRLKEIIFANVAETEISTRASASASDTTSGQTPVQTGDDTNKTAARALGDTAEEVAQVMAGG